MRILAMLFVFIFCVSCEKLSSLWNGSEDGNAQFATIEPMYVAYNKKELDAYCSFFTDEINVFKEQGLGNTRILVGKEAFKTYYERVFRTKKKIKITPLQHFSVYPWVMVKELIELDDQVFEAAVGYRLDAGKIRDRMILSENFLVDKKKLSVEIPEEKSRTPVPHRPVDPSIGDTPKAK